MKKNPTPTEPYPKLIWYQERRKPCNKEEREILFKRYYDISLMRLEKLFPTAGKLDIQELAREKADKLVESEINLPTILKKVLVLTAGDHRLTKEMIEKSDTFLQWYQE